MKTKALLFSVIFCLPVFVLAQNTIHVPGDQPTIQAGIDAASDGDMVLVDQETYYENINFKGKAITVASNYINTLDSADIYNTIIDGSQPANPDSASVVFFRNNEDSTSVLCGFTIQGGSGTDVAGGGGKRGGGIFCRLSGPTIEHNRIINNICEEGGSMVAGGGIYIDYTGGRTIYIRYNLIADNTCINSQDGYCGAIGGGMGVFSATECVIHDNTIINNYVLHETNKGWAVGGGIGSWSSKLIITDNTIGNNLAETEYQHYIPLGGGIYAYAIKEGSLISGNMIHNNVITGIHSYGGGIGFLNPAGMATIDKNIISDNWAERGGGIGAWQGADIVISNNLLTGNYADEWGGAIRIRPPDNKMENMLPHPFLKLNISEEPVKSGQDISIVLSNNTIYKDTANYHGAAIYFDHESPLIAMNNIFYENISLGNYSEIRLYDTSAAYLFNNLLDTNRVVGGSWEGKDNIVGDPDFEDDSCHLSGSSICINTGLTFLELPNGTTCCCPDHDIDGQPRPQNGNVDIGSDEKAWGVGIEDPVVGSGQPVVSVYPNPTSGVTSFGFRVPGSGHVTVKIYSLHGCEVATVVDRVMPEGEHLLQYDAGGLPAGVYFCRVKIGENIETVKMIIL